VSNIIIQASIRRTGLSPSISHKRGPDFPILKSSRNTPARWGWENSRWRGCQTEMANETKSIELWPGAYQAPCKARNSKAKATTIARAVNASGRLLRQYELYRAHAEQIANRELARGRRLSIGK
jgi:hypothetical protein